MIINTTNKPWQQFSNSQRLAVGRHTLVYIPITNVERIFDFVDGKVNDPQIIVDGDNQNIPYILRLMEGCEANVVTLDVEIEYNEDTFEYERKFKRFEL